MTLIGPCRWSSVGPECSPALMAFQHRNLWCLQHNPQFHGETKKSTPSNEQSINVWQKIQPNTCEVTADMNQWVQCTPSWCPNKDPTKTICSLPFRNATATILTICYKSVTLCCLVQFEWHLECHLDSQCCLSHAQLHHIMWHHP